MIKGAERKKEREREGMKKLEMFHKCERRNKKRPRGGWKKIGAPV